MNICIYGFSTMDYKGEETNELFFISKIIEELKKSGAQVYYLYHQSSMIGLNNEGVFNLFNIPATRLPIDKYTNFSFKEYSNYKLGELESVIDFNYKLDEIINKRNRKAHFLHSSMRILENLQEYDKLYNFDCYLFWGNSLVSSTLRLYCNKHNKKYFNFENGYFRPFTLMIDPKGVNFESSIPREKSFYENIEYDENKFQSFLYTPLKAKENKNEVKEYKKKYYEYLGYEIKETKTTSVVQPFNQEILNEEYIYVPFQLETDSQIIKHSMNIKSMFELVKFTLKGVKAYNLVYKKNIKVVYKEHPLYKTESKIADRESIRKLISENKEAIYLSTGDNNQLVKNAKAVITINSTVGIEALCQFKPVITLGDCFYNIDNLVWKHNFSHCLSDTINAALTNPINKNLIKRFLYYLRFEYFEEVYKLYPDEASIRRIVNKVTRI